MLRSTYRTALLWTLPLLWGGTAPVLAQDGGWNCNLVVPQQRVLLPEAEGSPVRMETVDVDVAIRGQVASTTVSILLRNPTGRVQESRLLMPVPAGASVRQFRLEGLPNEGLAEVLPVEEARRIYEDIVRRTRDPGLVEFVGLNLIRSSVFPVPANGTQRMELVYEQVLEANGERVDYVLPRSASLEATGVKWSLSATLQSPRAIGAVYSPSHELATERRADGSVRVTVPDSSADNPGAFRLSYVVAASDGFAASVLAYPDPRVGSDGGGYFMLLLGLPGESSGPKLKREVTLVLDTSGSMRGEKLKQAKEAALQIIGGLQEGEMFNVIAYSDTVNAWMPMPQAKNAKTVPVATKFIEGLSAVGGTNIHDALVRALEAEPAQNALPMVLFLTDGLPTVGVRRESDLREAARRANRHERRIFSFGVGFDVNSPLLTAISSASRGTTTFVLPDEDIEVKVGQVFRRLQGPVLVKPELSFEAVDPGKLASAPVRELLPGSLNDVFEGEQVLVLGQYLSEEPVRFTLAGTDGSGEPLSYEVTFDPENASVEHSYVGRIWATRKIGSLIDEIRRSGADGGEPPRELVDEVIRLSTDWGILTEYTAFLAVEEDEVVESRFGVPEEVTDAPAVAYKRVTEGVRLRSGESGLLQDYNAGQQADADWLNLRNSLRASSGGGGGGAEYTFVSVRQVGDTALYRRGPRWVDARLLDKAESEPERVIEFGSEEYFDLVDRLARENRSSLLAEAGDVYLVLDGRRTLVRQTP